MSHKSNRALLGECCGHPVSLPYLLLLHMAGCVKSLHDRSLPPGHQKRRGRPPNETARVKRARIDAWNAFVRYNPPACPRSEMARVIKEGVHMQNLGARWNQVKNNPVLKKPWEDLAVCDKQQAVHQCSLLREERRKKKSDPTAGP